jgi:hypothetical protein
MELKFDSATSWPNRLNWFLEMLECCPKLQHFTIQVLFVCDSFSFLSIIPCILFSEKPKPM